MSNTHLREDRCRCSAVVFVTEEFQGEPKCMDCGRNSAGIDWPWFTPLGEWHPTVGYALPAVDPGTAPAVDNDGWRWGCVACGSSGNAVDALNAVSLGRNHERYACPAFAQVYDDSPAPPRPGRDGRTVLPEFVSGEGFVQRVARHNALARIYPDEIPRWKGRWRERAASPHGQRAASSGGEWLIGGPGGADSEVCDPCGGGNRGRPLDGGPRHDECHRDLHKRGKGSRCPCRHDRPYMRNTEANYEATRQERG